MKKSFILIPSPSWRLLLASTLLLFIAGCAQPGPNTGKPATVTPPASLPSPTTVPTGLNTQVPLTPTATQSAPVATRTFWLITTPERETMPETPAPIASPDPFHAGLVDLAAKDLATRLQVAAVEIEFLQFEEITWPDGSMGCPRPGMAYTQVMVDGYRILLRHSGQDYAYHGGGDRPPFLCENPSK